jgi:hypothetical protein
MKKKIGTMLDEGLLFEAKKVAVSQKKPLNQLFGEALKMYLNSIDKKKREGRKNVSQRTHGAMSISPSALKTIMEEEGVYEA